MIIISSKILIFELQKLNLYKKWFSSTVYIFLTLYICGSLTGGSIVGDIAPYQAFAIGGLGSVRGYGEGAVGCGRSCLVANTELTFPMVCLPFSNITYLE